MLNLVALRSDHCVRFHAETVWAGTLFFILFYFSKNCLFHAVCCSVIALCCVFFLLCAVVKICELCNFRYWNTWMTWSNTGREDMAMTSIVAPAAFCSKISSSSWTKRWKRAKGKFKKKKKGLLCWLQAFCDQSWVEFSANRSKTFPNVTMLGEFGLGEFVMEKIKCLIEQYYCKEYIYFFFHWCSCAQQIYFHILTYWSAQASKGQPIIVSDNGILCVLHSLRRGHWVKTMNFLFKKSSLKNICGANGRTLCWKKSPWYILFSRYLSSLAWKSFFLSTCVWFESLALLKLSVQIKHA